MSSSLASPADRPAVVLGRRTGTRIRIVGRTASPGPGLSGNRRRAHRLSPDDTAWSDAGRLRTGHDVKVLDISASGVRIHAPVRLHVGGRVEVCLTEAETEARLVLSGVVRRCQVASLDPLTYTGALEFDRELELATLQPFVARTA